jgi:hypothetical protein
VPLMSIADADCYILQQWFLDSLSTKGPQKDWVGPKVILLKDPRSILLKVNFIESCFTESFFILLKDQFIESHFIDSWKSESWPSSLKHRGSVPLCVLLNDHSHTLWFADEP